VHPFGYQSQYPGVRAHAVYNSSGLDYDSLYLIERNLIARPIIQLRGPRRFMCCDRLGIFDRTPVFQVSRDPSLGIPAKPNAKSGMIPNSDPG